MGNCNVDADADDVAADIESTTAWQGSHPIR